VLLAERLQFNNRVTVMLIAQLIGGIAFFIGILAFWQKDDKKFRYQMMGYCFVMSVHFLMLGSASTAIGSAINGARIFASIKSQSKVVMSVFIILLVTLTLPNVDKWYELPPIIGSVLATWALFSAKGVQLRLLILFNSVCWLLHNVLAGSIGGSIIEASFVITNIATIYQLVLKDDISTYKT